MRIRRISSSVMVVFALVQATPAPAQTAAWQPPTPTPGAIAPQGSSYKQDVVEFTLAPNEGMEYKYRLEKGAAFVYTWTASAPLHFEMHSVPDGAPSSFAETFEKLDDRPAGHGSYTAPFPGIHGWYWQNRTTGPVTLKMTTVGFYSGSQEFRKGQDVRRKSF
jgi:hypothetical protein